MKYIFAIKRSELLNGEKIGLTIDQHSILLIRQNDAFYAYKNQCSHLRYPLSDAALSGNELTCSLHHWRYDIRDGRGINPLGASLEAYPVMTDGDGIFIGFED